MLDDCLEDCLGERTCLLPRKKIRFGSDVQTPYSCRATTISPCRYLDAPEDIELHELTAVRKGMNSANIRKKCQLGRCLPSDIAWIKIDLMAFDR